MMKNKLLLIIMYAVVCSCMYINVSAIDFTYIINSTDLPMSWSENIQINSTINSTINITGYGPFTSGVPQLNFTNINQTNLTVNINIPVNASSDEFKENITLTRIDTNQSQSNIFLFFVQQINLTINLTVNNTNSTNTTINSTGNNTNSTNSTIGGLPEDFNPLTDCYLSWNSTINGFDCIVKNNTIIQNVTVNKTVEIPIPAIRFDENFSNMLVAYMDNKNETVKLSDTFSQFMGYYDDLQDNNRMLKKEVEKCGNKINDSLMTFESKNITIPNWYCWIIVIFVIIGVGYIKYSTETAEIM